MDIVNEKWPEIIEHLRIEHELSNVSFNTWIQPLRVYDVIDNTVFILVNINASVEYIEKKYLLPLIPGSARSITWPPKPHRRSGPRPPARRPG